MSDQQIDSASPPKLFKLGRTIMFGSLGILVPAIFVAVLFEPLRFPASITVLVSFITMKVGKTMQRSYNLRDQFPETEPPETSGETA